jgi:hypothetical protein
MNTALVQVLGAIAYGELKAYEGAKEQAAATSDEGERKRLRKVAAEELRHHKGFVARLEAMGADPERAMRPYRGALDTYHGKEVTDPVEDAVYGYLGEGVADDLLTWLRQVVDPETAAFVDTVIEDEVGHEAAAAAELREVLETVPGRPAPGRGGSPEDDPAHALERPPERAADGRLPPPREARRAARRHPRRPRPPHAGGGPRPLRPARPRRPRRRRALIPQGNHGRSGHVQPA